MKRREIVARFLGSTAALALTTLLGSCADQSKVESKCVDLEATAQTISLRDYQFDRFRIMDLGKIGGKTYWQAGDSMIEFSLFISGGNDLNDPIAVAYPDWTDTSGSPNTVKAQFRFLSLINAEGDGDYLLDPGRFLLCFPACLRCVETQTLAYFMVIYTRTGRLTYFGDLSGGTLQHPLRLQMLKHAVPSPDDGLWDAEWRNVYDLCFRDFNYEDLALEIYAGRRGDEDNRANPNCRVDGMSFLRALGLDRRDASGLPIPDGKIDDDPAILDRKAGLLIFPNRFPFADSLALDEPVPILYNTADNLMLLEESRYYIKVTVTARPRTVRLGVVNVIEDSEVITLNGRRLHRGTDYYIDYDLGQVTFITDDALDPNASVTACCDYIPWR